MALLGGAAGSISTSGYLDFYPSHSTGGKVAVADWEEASEQQSVSGAAAGPHKSVVEHSLFHPERAYFEAKVAAPQAPAQPQRPWPNLKLIGVFSTPSGGATAMVKSVNDKRSKTVREGDVISGWRVEKISESEVIFVISGQTRKVELAGTKSINGGSASRQGRNPSGQLQRGRGR